MVYHQTYRIRAPGDAREDGMLWAGYGRTHDGWTDFDSVIWVNPTLWNKARLRWKGRHSILWAGRSTRWWQLWE